MRAKHLLEAVATVLMLISLAIYWDLLSSLKLHSSASRSPSPSRLLLTSNANLESDVVIPSDNKDSDREKSLLGTTRDAADHKDKSKYKDGGNSSDSLVLHLNKLDMESSSKQYFGPYSGKYFEDLCSHTKEELVECSSFPSRPLTPLEVAGGDILFSVKTTLAYHKERPQELLDTWLGDYRNPENVYFVSDAEDESLERKLKSLGMHFMVAPTGQTHRRRHMCAKTGVEMGLLLRPENSKLNWLCHVDDDIYVNVKSLVRALSQFDPKTERVYFGRSGYRQVKKWPKNSTQEFGYAQGGMYCLNRAMLEMAKHYIVGPETFKLTCNKAVWPDDITLGLVIGAILKESLKVTNMIFTHYPDYLPDNAHAPYFKDQIAFPYGFGTTEWSGKSNISTIPGKLHVFDRNEDKSQFRSLHCFLNPDLHWCLDKKRNLEAP